MWQQSCCKGLATAEEWTEKETEGKEAEKTLDLSAL